MNYIVRVLTPGFMIGSTLHPINSEVEVNDITKRYLVGSGAVEVVREMHYGTDQVGYNRRDMQVEDTPTTKRKRRTKAEMELARSQGSAR